MSYAFKHDIFFYDTKLLNAKAQFVQNSNHTHQCKIGKLENWLLFWLQHDGSDIKNELKANGMSNVMHIPIWNKISWFISDEKWVYVKIIMMEDRIKQEAYPSILV